MLNIVDLYKIAGEEAALNGVSCEIADNEIISLIGTSGSGKSALLKCINGLCAPSGGKIIINGTNILDSADALAKARRHMSMVFRSINLFDHLTIIENVMLGPVEARLESRQAAYDEGMRLLRNAGLAQKALAYPSELADGQKQRAAIVRAIAMKPALLLIDEPTAQVGPTMRDEVHDYLLALRGKGMTMMIATHELKFAQEISNRIFYMENGVIVESGTPAKLFSSPERESTKVFIKHLKQFEYVITAHDYDFMDVNSEMTQFAHTHFFTKKQMRDIELMFEELCAQTILPRLKEPFKLTFTVAYQDSEAALDVGIHYDGGEYDPIKNGDELTVTLVKRLSRSVSYSYDKKTDDNFVRIEI